MSDEELQDNHQQFLVIQVVAVNLPYTPASTSFLLRRMVTLAMLVI